MAALTLTNPVTGAVRVTVTPGGQPTPQSLYICPACGNRACPGTRSTCPARWR